MEMLTRFAAALVAACALIGSAHADPAYTLDNARSMGAAALMAQEWCPGVRFSARKTRAMIDASRLNVAEVFDQDEGTVWFLKLRLDKDMMESLCGAARDTRLPFHFLLDIED